MANKCFESIQNNLSQTDYISNIKSKTLYKTAKDNVGVQEFISTTSDGCLVQTKNHEHLLHVIKGKYLCDPPITSINIKGSINEGNLYVTDLSGLAVVDTSFNAGNYNSIIHPINNSVNNISTSTNSNYPGSIVDPSNTIFSVLSCEEDLIKGINKTHIDISFSSNIKYTTIMSQKLLSGFTYPTKIKL